MGSKVTAMQEPETIYDYGGFPRELYEVQNTTPGSTEVAEATRETVQERIVELDRN